MAEELNMPQMGYDMKEGVVVKWLKEVGSSVNIGDPIAEIETYNDHRMAMSFAIAGLIIPKVKIKNPKCEEKSFPDFFSQWPPCKSG